MANIDVSELLRDTDFIDAMQVVTRVPSVDSFGQSHLKEVNLSSFGSVQPASGDALSRLPEALRSADMKSFWFNGVIVSSADGLYPSILIFKDSRYQVKNVFDWTNWGAGWTEGLCVAEKPA